MAKTYLKSYKPEMFQALNSDGTTYIMYLEKHYFWGHFKKEVTTKIEVPFNSTAATHEKWDSIIKSGQPIK